MLTSLSYFSSVVKAEGCRSERQTTDLCEQHFGQIGGIPAGFEPFGLDPMGTARFLAEQAHGEVTQHCKVLRRMVTAQPTLSFPKDHVAHPVQPLLDAPVSAHRLPKLLGVAGQTGQILAALHRCLLTYSAICLDHPQTG